MACAPISGSPARAIVKSDQTIMTASTAHTNIASAPRVAFAFSRIEVPVISSLDRCLLLLVPQAAQRVLIWIKTAEKELILSKCRSTNREFAASLVSALTEVSPFAAAAAPIGLGKLGSADPQNFHNHLGRKKNIRPFMKRIRRFL